MKFWRILTAVLVFAFCLGVSGCSTFTTVDDSKTLLDEYIAKYNENAVEDAIMMFHNTLVADLGGEENTNIIMTARRALQGEVKSYEVTNTSFETVNGVTEVVLNVTSQYENSKNAEDTYTFLTVDDGLYITGINFEKEEIVDEILTNYYKNYANPDKRKLSYVPFALDQIDEEYLSESAEKVKILAGEYKDYEVIDKNYAIIPFGDSGGNCYMMLTIRANYQNMSFISKVQISKELNRIGINYEEMIPEKVATLKDVYFNGLEVKDIDEILALYSEDFFGKLTDNTKESWANNVIIPILNDYGVLNQSKVVDWSYDSVDVLGAMEEVYIMYTQLIYEHYTIREQIIFGVDDNEIVGHFLEVDE